MLFLESISDCIVSVALYIVSKDVKFCELTNVTAPVYDFKWGRLEM
jgi:hypothetical protein